MYLTARLAGWCARHPWRVLGAWIVLVAVSAAAVALALPDVLDSEARVPQSAQTDSQRVRELLEERMPGVLRQDVELLVLRDADVAGAVRALRDAGAVPLPEQATIRRDRSAALLPFRLGGTSIGDLLPVVDRLDAEVYGGAIVDRDFRAVSQSDLRRGEAFGVAAALVILVLVFGSLVAAVVPLVLAGVAIAVSLGIVTLVGQAATLSIFVTNIVSGMGLALGIDYALFVVSRYREERLRGRGPAAAVEETGATAARAVTFSGVAVAVALSSMLFPPDAVLRSLGAGASIVAVVSVAGALTLLPALLGLLGDRVDAVRIPFAGGTGEAEGRFWSWAARAVMRRPVPALVLSAGLLVACALPVLGLETGSSGVSTLPDRTPAKQGFTLLERTFSIGRESPVRIVVEGDAGAAVARLRSELRRDPAFGAPRARRSADGTLLLLEVPVAGDPTGEEAVAAVERLRGRLVAEASFPPGAAVLVGGETANHMDYVALNDASRPWVFGFVLGLSFVLLMLAFRSVVVPAKAILLNLLSVGAAYGLLVLVFQDGIGNELLGLDRVETIEVWVPLLLFAVLFGLSMDYHVFLLSRIRERYVETGDNTAAVAFGVATTGRIITGAALIIVVVFAGFALGDLVMFQQIGFGVALALLLDATVVRSVLVPATMRLLGGWNWYLPRWLSWLPRVELERGGA
ncbi:MAG TPA: MMPL family transporter [Gaiellaceae bacterium]|nr:MMPL family transporter [Gaiellaceae bacterium]